MLRLFVYALVIQIYGTSIYAQNLDINVVSPPVACRYEDGIIGDFLPIVNTYGSGTYSIPALYTGDIILIGSGQQDGSMWDVVYNNNTHTGDFIRPADFTLTGSGYEKGFLHYDYNGTNPCNCIKEEPGGTLPYPDRENAGDVFRPYIKIRVPLSIVSFSISYTQRYTDPYGNITSYTSGGTTVLLVGQSAPIGFEHYHQVQNSSQFNTPVLLKNSYRDNVKLTICADGSTASLIKLKLTDNGSKKENLGIRIKEDTTGNKEIYGSFSSFTYVSTDTISTRYTHPSYFESVTNFTNLTVEIYLLNDPTVTVAARQLTIYRTPVLMVHGLWSGSESFVILETALENEVLYPSSNPKLIRRADYSTTNSSGFAANVPKIKTEVDLLIESVRDQGIAAGNVDYIGHSMGGILGRLYLQGETYQCGFHKLITLNTPHSGSHLANLLTDFKSAFPGTAGVFCSSILPISLLTFASGDACGDGAIDNLRVDSPEITTTLNGIRRNFRTVPSHTITTVEYQTAEEIKDLFTSELPTIPANPIAPVNKKVEKLLAGASEARDVIVLADIVLHSVIDFVSSSFFGGLNDLVVSQISQQGGMLGDCTTTIDNQSHSGSPENVQVIDRIKSLLIDKPSSVSFCPYFSPIPLGKSTVPLINPNGSIAIRSPRKGQSLRQSANTTVSAMGTNLTEITTYIEYSTTQLVLTKAVGTSIVCTVPTSNELGRKRIVAIGKTASGGYVTDTTYFYVRPISNFCETVQSGAWTSPSTWSCGHEPTTQDVITVNPTHTVTVSTSTAQAKQIIYSGGIILFTSGNSTIRVKGDG